MAINSRVPVQYLQSDRALYFGLDSCFTEDKSSPTSLKFWGKFPWERGRCRKAHAFCLGNAPTHETASQGTNMTQMSNNNVYGLAFNTDRASFKHKLKSKCLKTLCCNYLTFLIRTPLKYVT